MSWQQFKYIFNPEVENAMRYSIQEAMRLECRKPGGGSSEAIAKTAVESFKRKMEKHTK